MKRGTLVVHAVAVLLLGSILGSAGPARAAVDMFLKIDDIKGESRDDKHKDEIDVLAWSWGVSSTATVVPRTAGRVEYKDLSVTKYADRATVPLFLATATGRHYRDATLTVRKAGERPLEYFKIFLKDVLVTSLATGGSGGEDRLTENITLGYGSVSFFYTPDGGGIEPPRVTNPGAQTNAEGEAVSLQIVASAPFVESVTFDAAGLPPGLAIARDTGLISGTLPFDAAGVYSVTVAATDPGGLTGVAQFAWNVTNTNRAPQIAGVGDRSNVEGDAVSLQIPASDPDGDALRFAADFLPPGLSIDPVTGLIQGVVAAGAAGTYPVMVAVSDPGGATAMAGFTWTVALGQPRISGAVAAKGWASSPGVMYLDVTLTNTGTGHARNVVVKTIVPRTLMGTGAVTYNASLSPALPLTIGDLNVGASTTVRLYFNVPATVTRFSVTEGGTVQDVRGTAFNYSTGQAVIP